VKHASGHALNFDQKRRELDQTAFRFWDWVRRSREGAPGANPQEAAAWPATTFPDRREECAMCGDPRKRGRPAQGDLPGRMAGYSQRFFSRVSCGLSSL
jgi:hypothetical protein